MHPPSLPNRHACISSHPSRLKPTQPQLPLQILLRSPPPQHHDIDNDRQHRSPHLRQPRIPTCTLLSRQFFFPTTKISHTYLHITKPLKIDLPRKLPLNRPRSRTTRPPPQIITFSVLVFFSSIHARRYTPDYEISEHDNPAKHRGDVARGIRLFDAVSV
jgi:hypothetical protein